MQRLLRCKANEMTHNQRAAILMCLAGCFICSCAAKTAGIQDVDAEEVTLSGISARIDKLETTIMTKIETTMTAQFQNTSHGLGGFWITVNFIGYFLVKELRHGIVFGVKRRRIRHAKNNDVTTNDSVSSR